MVINGVVGTPYTLVDASLTSVDTLRFLGILIDSNGCFKPHKTDFSKPLWALFTRVKNLGLSCFPQAYIRAY